MLFLTRNRQFKLIGVLLFILVIGCKESSTNTLDDVIKAPAFTLHTLDNEEVSLSDYSGKYLVIHIATTWCPYCNAEMPHLEQLYADYKTKNVEVIVIDVKETEEIVNEKLRQRFDMKIPILLDVDGEVAGSFAPEDVLPDLARDEVMLASNLVIDPEGNIMFMSLLDTKNFDTELVEIKQLLDEVL